MPTMPRSSIAIERGELPMTRLEPVRPGEILKHDFMEPLLPGADPLRPLVRGRRAGARRHAGTGRPHAPFEAVSCAGTAGAGSIIRGRRGRMTMRAGELAGGLRCATR